jgi:hypothetical protein
MVPATLAVSFENHGRKDVAGTVGRGNGVRNRKALEISGDAPFPQSWMSLMDANWPFSDPPNVAAITLRSIVERGQPILFVSHDSDDGYWQFMDGGDELRAEDAMVIALKEIVEIDESIIELADLPLGWFAQRRSRNEPWKRGEKTR